MFIFSRTRTRILIPGLISALIGVHKPFFDKTLGILTPTLALTNTRTQVLILF